MSVIDRFQPEEPQSRSQRNELGVMDVHNLGMQSQHLPQNTEPGEWPDPTASFSFYWNALDALYGVAGTVGSEHRDMIAS
jgi:hypothetical protein